MSCICNEINLTLNTGGSLSITTGRCRSLHSSRRMDWTMAFWHFRVLSNGLTVTNGQREDHQTALRAPGRGTASLSKWTCKNSARRAQDP
jgi:hypothetical protein